jgi:hypothetical protein
MVFDIDTESGTDLQYAKCCSDIQADFILEGRGGKRTRRPSLPVQKPRPVIIAEFVFQRGVHHHKVFLVLDVVEDKQAASLEVVVPPDLIGPLAQGRREPLRIVGLSAADESASPVRLPAFPRRAGKPAVRQADPPVKFILTDRLGIGGFRLPPGPEFLKTEIENMFALDPDADIW